MKTLQTRAGATAHQTLIFGDDYLDAQIKEDQPDVLFVMPKNGIFYLVPLADSVLPVHAATEGALRLLLDLILFVQDKHPTAHLITKALAS